MLNKTIAEVTKAIQQRSQKTRDSYIDKCDEQAQNTPYRTRLSCGNLAHAFAACDSEDKQRLSGGKQFNLGIVTAYNDMLSAHHPYANYPDIIKSAAHQQGATAQVAGGVPAMCDGVTQGRAGMELSLFSRDNIAMSAAIALSHDMFDAVTYLGICDKIVPGLLIGGLSFGHLPGIFIPAGPMGSGLPNKEKARVRQEFAQGKADKKELLKAESASYHSSGTCTFYGTANSNQMLMEIMGLQLPSSSFEHPNSSLRDPLTHHAVKTILENNVPLKDIVDVKSIVNAVVGLLATGGSTNHTIHLIAIAKAAGVILKWEDLAMLSEVVPLICRVYPNGEADVNHFHAEGGMAFVIQSLLDNGYLHNDVTTVLGHGGLAEFTQQPNLVESNLIGSSEITASSSILEQPVGKIRYEKLKSKLPNRDILRPADDPFSVNGGLRLLTGNIGQSVIKTSAVAQEHQKVTAPAKVFQSQEAFIEAFNSQALNQDFVAVLQFQGPKSNGMPELHKLTPLLGSLQDQGFKVALITDGRMSGASGKVPAAIHLVPEAIDGGPIAQIQDGDLITLDCTNNELNVALSKEQLDQRKPVQKSYLSDQRGMGRELFNVYRRTVSSADLGASLFDS